MKKTILLMLSLLTAFTVEAQGVWRYDSSSGKWSGGFGISQEDCISKPDKRKTAKKNSQRNIRGKSSCSPNRRSFGYKSCQSDTLEGNACNTHKIFLPWDGRLIPDNFRGAILPDTLYRFLSPGDTIYHLYLQPPDTVKAVEHRNTTESGSTARASH